MEGFKNTFSDILQAEKKKNLRLTRTIVTELEDIGIHLTQRTIQNYMRGSIVPDYNVAKTILSLLNIQMPEKVLLEVLNNSIESKNQSAMEKIAVPDRVYNNQIPSLKKRLCIRADEFTFLDGTNVPKEDSIDLILDKIKEQYGTDKFAFNRYIKDLIDKDIKG